MRVSLLVLGIAACSPYDDNLGPTPFLCGQSEPRCPHGYSCVQDPDSGKEVCSQAAPADFNCADDSAHEPNETTVTAGSTPIDSMQTFELPGLAICPQGDVDTFSVSVTATEGLELLVTYEDGGGALEAAILNTGGVPIATAVPLGAGSTTIRAVAVDLTPGSYFVQVNGPAMGFPNVNNYQLAINVIP